MTETKETQPGGSNLEEEKHSLELKKLDILEQELRLKRWANPLAVAIASTIIALGGQGIAYIVTDQRAKEQRVVEEKRADAQLELERLKFEYGSLKAAFAAYAIGNEAQAMKMLHFYSKLGLIDPARDKKAHAFLEDWLKIHRLSQAEFNALSLADLEKLAEMNFGPATRTDRLRRLGEWGRGGMEEE